MNAHVIAYLTFRIKENAMYLAGMHENIREGYKAEDSQAVIDYLVPETSRLIKMRSAA